MEKPVETDSTVFIFLPFVTWVKLLGLSLNFHTTRNRVSTQTQVIQTPTTASSSACEHHPMNTVQSLANPVSNSSAGKFGIAGQFGEGFKGLEHGDESEHLPARSSLKTSRTHVQKSFWWFLEKIYSLIVLMFVWFSFGWTVSIFAVANHPLDHDVLPLAVLLIWALESSVMCSIFYALGFLDWLSNLFGLLDVCHRHAVQGGLKPEELFLKLKRRIRSATAAIIVCSSVFFAGEFFVLSIIPDQFLLSFVATKMKPFYTSQLSIFCFRTGMCFSVLSWFNTLAFLTLLIYVFGQYFRFLSDDLKSRLSKDEDDFNLHLKSYRETYQSLTDVVHEADKYLRFIFGIHCVAFITTVVFALYTLVEIENSFPTAIPSLVISSVLFSIAMLQGCVLHEQAKAPLKTLFRVQLRSTNIQHAGELYLFIQTVIHGEVGITVLDLFIVDKSAIVTIYGVVVSYFFVIIGLYS